MKKKQEKRCFLLIRNDYGYDENRSKLVIAHTPSEARKIAAQHGPEGREPWLNPKRSSCSVLNPQRKACGVYMTDFHTG